MERTWEGGKKKHDETTFVLFPILPKHLNVSKSSFFLIAVHVAVLNASCRIARVILTRTSVVLPQQCRPRCRFNSSSIPTEMHI